MCLPVVAGAAAAAGSATAASTALMAVQIGMAALSFVNQLQAANAQADAIEANYRQQMESTAEQQRQNNAAAAQQMSERAREAQIERARLRVLAGESGLSGVSTDRIENASRFNEGYDIATIEANRLNASKQITNEAKGIRAQSQSKLNTIDRPSLIGTGLQIVGSIAQTGAETERLNRIGKATQRVA